MAKDHATLEDVQDVFRLSDLVTSAGTGHNGALLADTLAEQMPAELEGVLNQRENLELGRRRESRIERDEWAKVADVAGIKGRKLADLTVRGGADEDGNNVDSEQAWITFVYYDDRGDTLKGAVPYLLFTDEQDKDDDREPILQEHAIAKSPAARDHAAAQEKAREAEDAEASADAPDPVDTLANAKASDLVKLMEDNPSRIEAIKAFELANKGDKARDTVMDFEPEPEEKADEKPAGDGQGDSGDSGDKDGDSNPS